jgi:ornithine cyclodeaminase
MRRAARRHVGSSALSEPLWITEAEVASLIDMGEAIAALEAGLRLEAAGAALNMAKTHAVWDGGHTLLAIGAVFPDAGFAATKSWAHAGGASPLLLLFDSHDGALKAVIEAFALGQLRTGGISGVATRWLALPEADEMGLIGSGHQALAQLAAVAAVRRLKRVRVFSPNPEHRAAFAARAAEELDLRVEPVASAEAAVEGAPIVTLVTRARAPVVAAPMIMRGAHVNAVGAISPERCEFGADLVARASRIVADSVPQVRALSRELIDAFGADDARWARVEPLAKIVAAGQARPGDADVTLFKAMGMGISDLSLAVPVYDRARAQGLGRKLPPVQRAKPRLKSQKAATGGQR